MEFFNTYTSNTTAASGNQHIFTSDNTPRAGRVFYRITNAGRYNYALLFSNITDSTFADGNVSHKNMICRPWEIISVRVGKCGREVFSEELSDADGINAAVTDFRDITFGGCRRKNVAPGEFFTTDPVMMEFDAGDYLCVELTYAGELMPYHEESLLPIFAKTADGWVYDRKMPLPGMIGCDRPVRARIGYLGDSITQGIGTAYNSYAHWNAVLAEKIGGDYAHWNLGLGFARANDIASDGAWLYKAKHNDIIVVCAGTNDLFRNPEDQIRRDLCDTVDILAGEGRTVVLQTIPPFEFSDAEIAVWKRLNEYIKGELADRVAMVFDVGSCIGQPDAPHIPIYGGHPNAEGCRLWADGLYEAMRKCGIV